MKATIEIIHTSGWFVKQAHKLSASLGLSQAQIDTYSFIAGHCRKSSGWSGFPSVQRIADGVGASVRTIYNHLKVLKRLRLITVRARYRYDNYHGHSRRTTSLYTLNAGVFSVSLQSLIHTNKKREKSKEKAVPVRLKPAQTITTPPASVVSADIGQSYCRAILDRIRGISSVR